MSNLKEEIERVLRMIALPSRAYFFDVRMTRAKPLTSFNGKYTYETTFDVSLIRWHDEEQVERWLAEADAEGNQ